MKSMQRKFGTLMKRSADQQDVGAILTEFETADGMLDSMLKDLTIWRNSWEDILKLQYDCSEALANLYKPIEPIADPEMRHAPAETPQKYLQKCLGLQKTYSDLKADLAQEIGLINRKLITPAEEAKKSTKMLHRTRKHRENMKLDYERYLSRAEHARRKEIKSAKEEAALATHESNLAQAQIDYQTADEQVKQTFPPVVDAVISLLPYLLANQVMLQTTLAGQLYTVLDQYTRKFGLPNPAPSDADIISSWDQEFTGFRKELEQGISVVANGKAAHTAMTQPEKDRSTITGLGIRNKVLNRNKSSQNSVPQKPNASSRQVSQGRDIEPEPEEQAPPKPPRPGTASVSPIPSVPMSNKPRVPSFNNQSGPNQAPYDQRPTALTPSWPNNPPPSYELASGGSTPPSRYLTPVNGTATPISSTSNSGADYFGNQMHRTSTASSIASSAAGAAAAKKKQPPPPVPTKRIPSTPQPQIVTAVFDFEGQTETDLSFREGDKIKVLKKTDSTDDWWTGELMGRTGEFPANYVKL